jgi:alginate O-acetyltransferase complex protein AlgI
MVFNSLAFAFFLLIVFLLYWFVFKKSAKIQNILLLLASVVFYCIAEWKFIFLLAASGGINFYLAKHIAKKAEGATRKMFFYFGIIVNVGILLYFKYFNFFVEGFVSLFNYSGFNIEFTPFHILLPLGISFFTFQMIGYLIDVNNEEVEPTNELLGFLIYVSYFPKILSGPIERIQRFLPQFQKKREFDYGLAVEGLRQILWGLFKKVVIADNCTPIVNTIFNDYQNLNGITLLLGAFFYLISVYADFSGYSDMACGVSKLFNIRITNNFAFPFFSTNISGFWKKWHISLTTWMMDYVFTPLNFILRAYKKTGLALSIFSTFLLVGLWHGANLTYVVFGILQGLYFLPLILKGSMAQSQNVAQGKLVPTIKELVGMLGLFILISITFILLRAENVSQAFIYVSGIFSWSFFSFPKGIMVLKFMAVISGLFIIEWIGRDHEFAISKLGLNWNRVFRFGFYYALIVAIFWFSGTEAEFIYFQF